MTTQSQALENRIGAEQVRSAYRNSAPGMIATLAGACLVSALVAGAGAVSWSVAIAFMSAMIVQLVARLALIFTYLRRKPPDLQWRRWGQWFTAGALVGGLTLGIGSVWLMPREHFEMQMLTLLYICAVASGAITAFGVLRAAIYSVIIPLVAIPIVWLALQGERTPALLALITLGWFLAVLDQARRYGAQFRESVRLRFENEDLIANLTQEKIKAEEASVAKSRFLAAASHDLRQPVHALSLFVAALRPRIPEPEAGRLLDHIDSSVQAMGGLFNGLLDISRLDAGVVEVSARTFALQPMLERICRDYASTAETKRIALRCRPTAAAVFTDPLLLERVVRNIVANAINYTDGGRVLVGCRRRGRTLRVGIWDTGRGIPAAEHEQIFKEFYQVDNPERDRSKGVGLGLAIVKRLTALLGHRLSFRSQPARGSAFFVDLPLSDAEIAPTGDALDAAAEGAVPGSGLVLVVDDEATIQSAMKSLLESWGYDAIVAGSCDEMLERLATCPHRPSLIVSDYRLRTEDGIRVIERLRSEYNDDEIPGMLITGDTAPDRIREAEASGLLLLHKPVSNHRLRAAILELTGHFAMRSGSRAGTSPPASG
jgi:signal transduction histidine kinase/ActR/RegA family two-component response regulator